MIKHNLILDIPDVLAPCILTINDISDYDFNDPNLCCQMLEITPPAFTRPIVFNAQNSNILSYNFKLNLTACDLGLQTEGCNDNLCSLSDGIYIIRYSISPNNVVYVEYNHLRITDALNRYKQTLCCLDLNKDKLGYEHVQKMTMLADFRTYLDAAKAMVEICHKPEEGMQMYAYALKILDKLNCNYC